MSENTQLIQPDRGQDAIPIHLVNADGFGDWAKSLSEPQRAALKGHRRLHLRPQKIKWGPIH